ncbi:glucosaminidase domain-containing protein [Acidobacteriia bacterium AH_259_A11_L15]|nr:glucosaminidase domain-containing protein [Acidobacteriia bacterium AH_259_A11_L15]
MTAQQANFLSRLVPAVLALQSRTGLPGSVVLAQAILESGWGRSLLARRNKNLFGIKAHKRSQASDSAAFITTEYEAGKARRQKARFASYRSYDACLQDYARLLCRPRYARARAVVANPFAFATELQRAGYATDPRYARKLHLLMRRYLLTQYDLSPGARAQGSAEPESTGTRVKTQ